MRGVRTRCLKVSTVLYKAALSGETTTDTSGKGRSMSSDKRKRCSPDREVFGVL